MPAMQFKTLAAALALLAAPAGAEMMGCRWSIKQQCDPDKACRALPNTTWAIADADTRHYQRCDQSGCDDYSSEVSTAGAFTTFDLVGRGVFMKLGADGAATEVVSLGNSVIISHGRCLPAPAPPRPQ